MRLVTYSTQGTDPQPGVLTDRGIASVRHVLAGEAPATVAQLLAQLPQVQQHLTAAVSVADADPARGTAEGWLVPTDTAKLHAPLGERGLLVCTGANFRSHLAEMGEQPPEKAAWAVKSPNAVIGPGEAIRLPQRAPDRIDYEGELGIVFGRSCFSVAAADAHRYIGGYTIINDVSDRSLLPAISAAATPVQGRWAWTDMLLGKQFPTFAPMGPAVLTADEVPDPAALRLTTTLNGTVMQDAGLDELAIDIPHLVEQLSAHFAFEPGDILTTGTPAGVGIAQDPPVFLRPGDTVSVEVTGIGVLTNTVTSTPTEQENR